MAAQLHDSMASRGAMRPPSGIHGRMAVCMDCTGDKHMPEEWKRHRGACGDQLSTSAPISTTLKATSNCEAGGDAWEPQNASGGYLSLRGFSSRYLSAVGFGDRNTFAASTECTLMPRELSAVGMWSMLQVHFVVPTPSEVKVCCFSSPNALRYGDVCMYVHTVGLHMCMYLDSESGSTPPKPWPIVIVS